MPQPFVTMPHWPEPHVTAGHVHWLLAAQNNGDVQVPQFSVPPQPFGAVPQF